MEHPRLTVVKTEEVVPRLSPAHSEYLAMVAHDLRSPSSIVVGLLDLVVHRWDELDAWQRRDLVTRAFGAARDASALIDDVFERSSVEAAAFAVRPRAFALGELIRGVIHRWTVAFPAIRVCVDIPRGLPPALGDPMRHLQVIGNLLSNAARFSDSTIEISVTHERSTLEVAVIDHGSGIEAGTLERIFDRRETSAASDGHDGAGLGLAICRTLIERQGGRIWAEHTPGGGATFRYTAPVAR